MQADFLIANPPYSKIGVDISRRLLAHGKQVVYLGTPTMVKVNHRNVSAECCYIQGYAVRGDYYEKLNWVAQTIWLAYPGSCRYIQKRTKTNSITSPWNIRVGFSMHIKGWNDYRDRNVLLHRNPKTSDILNCDNEEEQNIILNALLEPPPYNHKAMIEYGFTANFINEGEDKSDK